MKRFLRRFLLAATALVAMDVATAATGAAQAATPAQWTPPPRPHPGAPNVVLILIDDVGFGAAAPFGGPVSMPGLAQLAGGGARYDNFHVNALCSPSRAALLTGRNNHQVGFGDIAEWASPYPGYNSQLPGNVTPLAEVLRQNGYSTAAFGKWHNTPYWQVGPAGPFDLWPTGRWGFEHFYGFLKAADNQYYPRLYRDRTPVEPPATPAQGYHFTTDITNQAIGWLHDHDAVAHDRPFFLYFATGATHEPHQVPQAWIAKYKGRFDKGWDVVRQESFDRQKTLGIIPASAELTPRPAGLPAWASLTPKQRQLLAHQAEVYAAYLEQTDHEIGRLLQALRDEGVAGNTLVLEIVGDNGASAEGGLEGRDAQDVRGDPLNIDQRLAESGALGSELYMNHYAAAWAWALSSPFPGTKQDASHLGGTTDPLVVSWPGHIQSPGTVRRQFGHLNDIAPTIYEAAGITAPGRAENGEAELPIEGRSLFESFAHPDAPSRHRVQYFSTSGNRGIYADGWWAGDLVRNTWDATKPVYLGPGEEPHLHPWQLYHLDDDYSQARDVAAQYPAKLHELQALFGREAERNHAYPLHPDAVPYPVGAAGGQRRFLYRDGVERLAPVLGPDFGHLPYTLTADVVVPGGGAAGVILADGGRYGGLSLFVENNHAVLEVNSFGHRAARVVSATPLAPGHRRIVVTIVPASAGPEPAAVQAGRIGVSVEGGPPAEAPLASALSARGETLDVGADLGTAVSPDYTTPARFTGAIDHVLVEQTR